MTISFLFFVAMGISGTFAQENMTTDDVTESSGRQFVHRYRPGEEYRIVGINEQQLLVDGALVGEAEVLTRILITVENSENSEFDTVSTGVITAEYQISEEAETDSGVFPLERQYTVEFEQDELGRQTVPSGSFVPQVRDVPVFPDRPLRPGDTWTARGYEVYDFREGIGVEEPVVVPVDVQYEYIGPREFEDRRYDAISIQYNLFYRPSTERPESRSIRLMTARFSQELLWDYLSGRAHYYQEDYTLFVQLADGTRSEYRGHADGRVVGAPPLDRDQLRDDIASAIETDGIKDTSVRSDADGVTVSLENIQFLPDSAELTGPEKEKLQWLAGILARYPDRDVLITGHTALAGTEAGRQVLSEERAASVGDYLITLGARSRENIMYRGMGAREPVADNATEEGRRRNRRVEITILEN